MEGKSGDAQKPDEFIEVCFWREIVGERQSFFLF